MTSFHANADYNLPGSLETLDNIIRLVEQTTEFIKKAKLAQRQSNYATPPIPANTEYSAPNVQRFGFFAQKHHFTISGCTNIRRKSSPFMSNSNINQPAPAINDVATQRPKMRSTFIAGLISADILEKKIKDILSTLSCDLGKIDTNDEKKKEKQDFVKTATACTKALKREFRDKKFQTQSKFVADFIITGTSDSDKQTFAIKIESKFFTPANISSSRQQDLENKIAHNIRETFFRILGYFPARIDVKCLPTSR